MDITDPTPDQRVAAGARWLDEHAPNWLNRINTEVLNIRSSCNCVLGQIYDQYVWAPDSALDRALDCGFTAEEWEDESWVEAEFRALDEAWLSLIMSRRQA